jgi:hypothetical protein
MWIPAFGGAMIGAPPKPTPRVPFCVKGTTKLAEWVVEQPGLLPRRQVIAVPWSAIFPAMGGPPLKVPAPFLTFFVRIPMIGAATGSVTGTETEATENAIAPIDKLVMLAPEMVAVPEPVVVMGGRVASEVAKLPVKPSVAA